MALVHKITKAVIPAAGLGTRMLPATKVVPKEMLPVASKPLIQHAVEEAAAGGIETIILVTRREKPALQEHFNRDSELEFFLESRGKKEEAKLLRRLSNLVQVRSVPQDEPRGLGHAIGCARHLVGEEPFAVLLPDVIIDAAEPCTKQLIRAYAEHPGSFIAIREVEPEELGRHGVVRVEDPHDASNGRMLRAISLVEKPTLKSALPQFGIFGRYILEPQIFTQIENTPPAKDGEVQLTDALDRMCRRTPVYGFRFEGKHYDAGHYIGFLKANIELALKDPELQRPLTQYLLQLRLAGLGNPSSNGLIGGVQEFSAH
jgi:UTP--glucose-1-phosphate uridylyltransferase